MPVWNTSSVAEFPKIHLSDWKIYEVSFDGVSATRHFVGISQSPYEGRVSSPIVTFDDTTMTGVTSAGRVYQLVGNRGFHPDADYVFARWIGINEVTSFNEVDITKLL